MICPKCGTENTDDWLLEIDGKAQNGGCQMCWESECSTWWWNQVNAIQTTPRKQLYAPDVVSAPGETLRESLGIFEISNQDATTALELDAKELEQLLCVDMVLTFDLAMLITTRLRLGSMHFWLAREKHYRKYREKNAR